MTTTVPTGTAASFGELYGQVLNFYAGQGRHLDAMRADEFAATFTADGRFDHNPARPPLEGRQAIADEIRAYQEEQYAADPCQRRHWFSMIQLFPQDDGSVVSEYYALVVLTRPGEPVPTIAPSCFVRDALGYVDGELRVRERRVMPDYAVRP
jgi:actinorhodin biosynthesis protein ActVIA